MIELPTKCLEKKARWELHKDAAYCCEQISEAASYKTAVVRILVSHLQAIEARLARHAEEAGSNSLA